MIVLILAHCKLSFIPTEIDWGILKVEENKMISDSDVWKWLRRLEYRVLSFKIKGKKHLKSWVPTFRIGKHLKDFG